MGVMKMSVESDYLACLPTIRRVIQRTRRAGAFRNADHGESRSIAGLAFMRAWHGYRPGGRMSLAEYVGMKVRNAIKDHARREARRLRILSADPIKQRCRDHPPSHLLMSLSADALRVASVLIDEFHGGVRDALDRAKAVLYPTMGWRAFWRSIEEIETLLTD